MTLAPSINHSNQGFMNFPMEQPVTGHFSGPQKKKKATLAPGLSFPVFDGRSGVRVAGGGRGERKVREKA